MERCLIEYMALSPLRKILEYAKETGNTDLIVEVEMLLEEEEDMIKSAYQDGVDFTITGILLKDDWPTAEEYYDELYK